MAVGRVRAESNIYLLASYHIVSSPTYSNGFMQKSAILAASPSNVYCGGRVLFFIEKLYFQRFYGDFIGFSSEPPTLQK